MNGYDIFNTKQEEVFDTIIEYAQDEMFLTKVNADEINSSVQRLKNTIIPNAMNKDGIDYPVDIRNILYSIWLFCYKNDDEKLSDYADQIQFYNLLGIKGIELSVEQGNYNDSISGSAT